MHIIIHNKIIYIGERWQPFVQLMVAPLYLKIVFNE